MDNSGKGEILAMTRDEVLRAFDDMRVWQRGDKRAVHKPLLVLYALSQLRDSQSALIDWSAVDAPLKALLNEFGPSGSASSRHYPFWHLKTDGLWQLEAPANVLERPAGATPNLGELRRYHVKGGFSPPLRDALQADPQLASIIAHRIVDAHFPESIRADVLAAVGFSSDPAEAQFDTRKIRRRDPAFREKVLLAYQYRCGVCGHDLRLGNQTIGLEAAHIKWFQANGPDVVPNGIALCSMHHKVFDLGAFTVLPDTYQIVFSQHLNGGDEATRHMLAHQGAGLILPQSRDYLPSTEFLAWHQREVFKTPARS